MGIRATLTTGLVLMAIGDVSLLRAPAGLGFGRLWAGAILAGVGSGLLIAPSTAAAVGGVAPTQAGMASSLVNMFRQLGNVLGASVLGTILTSQFASRFTDRLHAQGLPDATVRQIVDGAEHGASGSGNPAIGIAAQHAFTDAFHIGVVVAGVVLLVVALLAVVFVGRKGDK